MQWILLIAYLHGGTPDTAWVVTKDYRQCQDAMQLAIGAGLGSNPPQPVTGASCVTLDRRMDFNMNTRTWSLPGDPS